MQLGSAPSAGYDAPSLLALGPGSDHLSLSIRVRSTVLIRAPRAGQRRHCASAGRLGQFVDPSRHQHSRSRPSHPDRLQRPPDRHGAVRLSRRACGHPSAHACVCVDAAAYQARANLTSLPCWRTFRVAARKTLNTMFVFRLLSRERRIVGLVAWSGPLDCIFKCAYWEFV
jgi:hypothetical protein